MTAYGVRSMPGARADAEPTDGLPTIRVGADRVPTRCERCSSTWLGYEEPLGPDARGMLWCQACSRSIAWVAAPLAGREHRTATQHDVVASRRSARAVALRAPSQIRVPVRRLLRTSPFARTPGCGPACTAADGHAPLLHERYGALGLRGLLDARASGDIATGPLLIQLGPGRVYVGEQEAALSPTEYKILSLLADHLGEVCITDTIYASIWGLDSRDARADAHMLRANISRLRARLGVAGSLIETAIGRGYRLADAPLC